MKGWSQEREWMHLGGDPAVGGARHGRHCGDGWNRWRQWLDLQPEEGEEGAGRVGLNGGSGPAGLRRPIG
jgi:hypothetical protein